LNFKTDICIFKYSDLVQKFVPLRAQPLFFIDKTAHINIENFNRSSTYL